MKEVRIEMTFKGYDIIEVPDSWEWDGTLSSLLEYSEMDSSAVELTDWTVDGK